MIPTIRTRNQRMPVSIQHFRTLASHRSIPSSTSRHRLHHHIHSLVSLEHLNHHINHHEPSGTTILQALLSCSFSSFQLGSTLCGDMPDGPPKPNGL